MFTSTSNTDPVKARAVDTLIPLIRGAATIGFAIAPCSLGFVIIAVSEQLIRAIMVGVDPEMLVSDLQNRFPNDIIEVMENDDAELVAKVVDWVESPNQALHLPVDVRDMDFPDASLGRSCASNLAAGRDLKIMCWDGISSSHSGPL